MESEIKKIEIPNIGIGTSNMKNIEEVVYQSIKDGVRLIDTASMYKNEVEVGKAINKAIEDGIVKREDLFIVTKFFLHEKEDPEKALKASLERLNLKYVDLYLDHWPSGKSYNGNNNFKLICIRDYWPKVEKLVEEGLTRAIGVSNYNVQNLLIVLSIAKIKPFVNEVEFHPYLYQKKLVEFCRRENIILFGYNPLVKGCYSADTADEEHRNLLGEKLIIDLSKKYNKTVGQIVLNWSISREVIPIPMTSNPHRMIENLKSTDFTMDKEDLQKIDKLNRNQRYGQSEIWDIYDNKIDVFA